MIYKGNRTNYGETIGILMMDSRFPRIPGDIGNATTFPFPVRYEIVKGSDITSIAVSKDPTIRDRMILGAKKLESYGVKAITGSCGFLAIWQKEIASQVNVPVFTSSLLQVPLAYTITGNKTVGIISSLSLSLNDEYFKSINASGIPVVIYGLENSKEFVRTFTNNEETLDHQAVLEEVTEVTNNMIIKNPDIGSIVLECTNLPPYASKIYEISGLPVFDIITLTTLVYNTVVKKKFKGHL